MDIELFTVCFLFLISYFYFLLNKEKLEQFQEDEQEEQEDEDEQVEQGDEDDNDTTTKEPMNKAYLDTYVTPFQGIGCKMTPWGEELCEDPVRSITLNDIDAQIKRLSTAIENDERDIDIRDSTVEIVVGSNTNTNTNSNNTTINSTTT